MDTTEHVREDAHDGAASVEHLRAVPIEPDDGTPRRRRVDIGDFVIWGGWGLALLLGGILIGLLPTLLK